jgi:hypothetical protein
MFYIDARCAVVTPIDRGGALVMVALSLRLSSHRNKIRPGATLLAELQFETLAGQHD